MTNEELRALWFKILDLEDEARRLRLVWRNACIAGETERDAPPHLGDNPGRVLQ